jgi:hypothetical protein
MSNTEEKKAKVKTSLPAVRVDIPTLLEALPAFPAKTPICIQGRAGIGKSETVAQVADLCRSDFYKDSRNCKLVAEVLAKRHPTIQRVLDKHSAKEWHYDFGIPMIMRRLAQTMEGDVTGVPRIVDRKFQTTGTENEVTQFKSLDWVLDGVEFPVLLFLDERNRALDAVKQAVFEMLDSHGFNGHAFHLDTRVYIAENIGDDYQVQALDPAEISRTALFHLEPSKGAWIAWAKKHVHPDIVKFIEMNKECLEYTGTFEPNKKYPDRRAWKRLSDSVKVLPNNHYVAGSEILNVMVKSLVGVETGAMFLDFLRKKSKELTAEQILDNWETNKSNVVEADGSILVDVYTDLAKKLINHIGQKELTKDHRENLKKFIVECPAEPRQTLFSAIMKSSANVKYYAEFNEVMASCLGTGINIAEKAPPPKKKK